VSPDEPEEMERRILAVFDELGVETVDLHLFFEMLPANTPPAQAEVLAAIEHLVRRGSLVEKGNDFYGRGRLP
jgi:hypothetical protein